MGLQSDPLETTILEILSRSSRPLKAWEIARQATNTLGYTVTRRDANRILYSSGFATFVQRNQEFRWSLLSTLNAASFNSSLPTCSPPVLPSEAQKAGPPVPETSRIPTSDAEWRVLSTEIGHWVFVMVRKKWEYDERWRFRCNLCGYQFQRTSKQAELLPLSGSQRKKRQRHDSQFHRETVEAQEIAETKSLGGSPTDDRIMPKRRSPLVREITESEVAVDRQMRRTLAHRLIVGFKLIMDE